MGATVAFRDACVGDRDTSVGRGGSRDLCRALGYRALVSQSEARVGGDQSVAAVETSAGVVDADPLHGVCLDPIARPALVGVVSAAGLGTLPGASGHWSRRCCSASGCKSNSSDFACARPTTRSRVNSWCLSQARISVCSV